MSSDVDQAEPVDTDAEEANAMAKALRWGIGLGTPVTIAVFFTIQDWIWPAFEVAFRLIRGY